MRCFIVVVCFVGCSGDDENLRLDAQRIFLRVEAGEMADSAGTAWFRSLTRAEANALYDAIDEHLDRLYHDDADPERHLDAGCRSCYRRLRYRDTNVGLSPYPAIF